jgi:hypothetical protein
LSYPLSLLSQFIHNSVIYASKLLPPRDRIIMAGTFGRFAGFRNVV